MSYIPKIEYYGNVTDGKLHIVHRRQFDTDIKRFEGKEVVIAIEKKKKKRSNEQNKYWWGILIPTVREGLTDAGYDFFNNEQVHEFLKKMFLSYEEYSEKTGIAIERIGETKKLSTTEFMDLIAAVQVWSSEFLNTIIPNPGEQLTIDETTTKD